MALLVAKFKDKRDADLVARFIRLMKEKVDVVEEESWEDFYFAQMIDEGMEEKGSIPLSSVKKKLAK